jgi:hypothetical protein
MTFPSTRVGPPPGAELAMTADSLTRKACPREGARRWGQAMTLPSRAGGAPTGATLAMTKRQALVQLDRKPAAGVHISSIETAQQPISV